MADRQAARQAAKNIAALAYDKAKRAYNKCANAYDKETRTLYPRPCSNTLRRKMKLPLLGPRKGQPIPGIPVDTSGINVPASLTPGQAARRIQAAFRRRRAARAGGRTRSRGGGIQKTPPRRSARVRRQARR